MGITGFIYPKKKKSSFTNSHSKKVRTIYKERIKAWMLHFETYLLEKGTSLISLFVRWFLKLWRCARHKNTTQWQGGWETTIYCTFTSAYHVLSDSLWIILSFVSMQSYLGADFSHGFAAGLPFNESILLSIFTQFHSWKLQFLW